MEGQKECSQTPVFLNHVQFEMSNGGSAATVGNAAQIWNKARPLVLGRVYMKRDTPHVQSLFIELLMAITAQLMPWAKCCKSGTLWHYLARTRITFVKSFRKPVMHDCPNCISV
jgi:aromatic ring-cleaving dioxygenase